MTVSSASRQRCSWFRLGAGRLHTRTTRLRQPRTAVAAPRIVRPGAGWYAARTHRHGRTALDAQLHRRMVLAGLASAGLAGCVSAPGASVRTPVRPVFQRRLLAPLLTDPGRLSRITVCLRPFQAQGPRIEAETVGDKRVVHNYGHGGSGWSLAWGSAAAARDLALQGGPRQVAVIGSGALGLTAALQVLRAGAPSTDARPVRPRRNRRSRRISRRAGKRWRGVRGSTTMPSWDWTAIR